MTDFTSFIAPFFLQQLTTDWGWSIVLLTPSCCGEPYGGQNWTANLFRFAF